MANFIIKLYVSFIPSSVAPCGCFREPAVAWSNAHPSLMRSSLPVRGPSCWVRPIPQSRPLPRSSYCLFQHSSNVSLSSRLLFAKRDKKLAAPTLLYICPLHPHLIFAESRLSEHQASSRKWARLWNLSLILSTLSLLESRRRVFASLQRERKKKQSLWLMGGLILIDLGCAGCNHWWWIFTKASASWARVQPILRD